MGSQRSDTGVSSAQKASAVEAFGGDKAKDTSKKAAGKATKTPTGSTAGKSQAAASSRRSSSR